MVHKYIYVELKSIEDMERKFQSIAKHFFSSLFLPDIITMPQLSHLHLPLRSQELRPEGRLWESQRAQCGLKSTDKGAWLPSLTCRPTRGESSSQAKAAAAVWEPSSAVINHPGAGRSSESQRFQRPTSSFLFLFFS